MNGSCRTPSDARQRTLLERCITLACVTALVGGCASRDALQPAPVVEAAAPAQPPQVAIAAPAPTPAKPPMTSSRSESGGNIDVYKQLVAASIHRANPQHLFEGAPPPMLKSIVVLSISIAADGKPLRVSVLRTNGYRDLAQRAVDSVHQAAPLPRPDARFMRGGQTEITESWLFRDDGRFQIRSIAQEQASSKD